MAGRGCPFSQKVRLHIRCIRRVPDERAHRQPFRVCLWQSSRHFYSSTTHHTIVIQVGRNTQTTNNHCHYWCVVLTVTTCFCIRFFNDKRHLLGIEWAETKSDQKRRHNDDDCYSHNNNTYIEIDQRWDRMTTIRQPPFTFFSLHPFLHWYYCCPRYYIVDHN